MNTMQPMATDDLAATIGRVRDALEKMTPGEWEGVAVTGEDGEILNPDGLIISALVGNDDAEGICILRNNVGRLLDEVERLHGMLDVAHVSMEGHYKDRDGLRDDAIKTEVERDAARAEVNPIKNEMVRLHGILEEGRELARGLEQPLNGKDPIAVRQIWVDSTIYAQFKAWTDADEGSNK